MPTPDARAWVRHKQTGKVTSTRYAQAVAKCEDEILRDGAGTPTGTVPAAYEMATEQAFIDQGQRP